jgi:hypothetical protein
MTYLAIGCRCVIGLVFLIAAVGKLRTRTAWASFRSSVSGMKIVPESVIPIVAVAVVGAELVVVATLTIPSTVVLGFAVASGVLVAFSAAIIAALRRKTGGTCRCFGISAAPFGIHHVVRNGALVAVAVTGALATILAPDTEIAAGGVAVATVASIIGVFLIVILDDLMTLLLPRKTT